MKSKEELKWLELSKKPAITPEERREKELAREAFDLQLKFERKALTDELLANNSRFSDPWEMANSKEAYPEAIDILIAHLSKPYHEKNKEGIVRALTVKDAKGKANKALLQEYDVTSKEAESLRWAIGNAFTVIIGRDDIGTILQIVKDKSNGMSRQQFVIALGRVKTEEIKNCLMELLDDPEMAPAALKVLRLKR